MDGTTARKLKPGDRILWDAVIGGTVVANTGFMITVDWDDGDTSSTHPDDMQRAVILSGATRAYDKR